MLSSSPTPLLTAARFFFCPCAGAGSGQVLMGSAGSVHVKDSPLLLQQIEAMQLSIKHLKNENNRLKVRLGEEPSCRQAGRRPH